MDNSSFELLSFLKEDEKKSMYFDRRYTGTENDYYRDILTSGTAYVGDITPEIKESQLYMLFSQCGDVQRIIMGLDAKRNIPCGFGFVHYKDSASPIEARKQLIKYIIKHTSITIDLDTGFAENRQFGRGSKGGQARDDYFDNPRKRRHV